MLHAFPAELGCDVAAVMALPAFHTAGTSVDYYAYTLPDGQHVAIPYRVYLRDDRPNIEMLPPVQQMICHCIFSRSSDGFVREHHIRALLRGDLPDWVLPYLLKIADEYILEIVEALYDNLRERDTARLRAFCRMNPAEFLRGRDRMLSYWDAYYRSRYFRLSDYPGQKLYKECFGYTKGMENF